jgi:hypothetical protein
MSLAETGRKQRAESIQDALFVTTSGRTFVFVPCISARAHPKPAAQLADVEGSGPADLPLL